MSTTDILPSPWIRILRMEKNVWLGLSGEKLAVGDRLGPKREVDSTNPIGLLPCLERSYGEVLADLRAREIELEMAQGEIFNLVPLDAIPSTAVASKIDYWIQLALNWLDQMPDSSAVRELLRVIYNESSATQRARHRAKRMLGRIGK